MVAAFERGATIEDLRSRSDDLIKKTEELIARNLANVAKTEANKPKDPKGFTQWSRNLYEHQQSVKQENAELAAKVARIKKQLRESEEYVASLKPVGGGSSGTPEVASMTRAQLEAELKAADVEIEGPHTDEQLRSVVNEVRAIESQSAAMGAQPVAPGVIDKIAAKANKIADDAKARRKSRTITRANKPGQRSGGSPLIPDAVDFAVEIGARAVAKGLTKGKELSAFLKSSLASLPDNLKPHANLIRNAARRIVMNSSKDGVIQPALLNDAIQTERMRHSAFEDETAARRSLLKAVGGPKRPKAEPKLRSEIDAALGVKKAPTYETGGPVDPADLLPEHSYALGTLVASIRNGKALRGTKEAADFIQKATDEGKSNLFDPETIAEIRGLEGRGINGGMTDDQIELVEKVVRHIAHLSKTDRTAMVLGKIHDLDVDGAKVVEELSARKAVPRQSILDRMMERPPEEPNPGRVATFFGRGQDSLGDMIHVAFGDGVMKKYVYEGMADAENAMRLDVATQKSRLQRVLDRHNVKAEQVGRSIKTGRTFDLPDAGRKVMTEQEALDIVLAAGDAETLPALLKKGTNPARTVGQEATAWVPTEGDIDALRAQLPQWLKDFGAESVKILKERGAAINKTSAAIDGVEVVKPRAEGDYYYPRNPDPVLRTRGVREEEMRHRAWAERMGFTKERTGGSVPFQTRPAIERIYEHIEDTAAYIHMAEPTLNVRKLIGRPEVLEAVQSRLGSSWRNTLMDRLLIAQGQSPAGRSDVGPIGRWFLRNTARTALWGRMSSAMQQVSGVPMVMARMTGKERVALMQELATLGWVRDPKSHAELTGENGYFANRYPATGDQTRLASGMDLPQTLPTTTLGRWYQDLMRAGMKPLEYGDERLAIAVYRAAKRAGTPNPIKRAEMLIRETQNATSPLDRSGLILEGERNPFVGFYSLFSSAPNRVRGMFRRDIADAMASPKDSKAWSRLATTSAAAIISVAMGEAIRELWRKERAGFQAERYPRSMLDNAVNSLATLADSVAPQTGTGLKSLINAARGKPITSFDSEGMQIAQTLGGLYAELEKDDGGKYAKKIETMAKAAARLLGVPGEAVFDQGRGVYRMFRADADIATYAAALDRGDSKEAARIAAEIRKAEPNADLADRLRNYRERITGVKQPPARKPKPRRKQDWQ